MYNIKNGNFEAATVKNTGQKRVNLIAKSPMLQNLVNNHKMQQM